MCFAKENEEFKTRYDSYSKEIEYYTDRVEQICINGSWYTMCDDALVDEVFYCEECDEAEWLSEACYIEELGQTVCRECYENFMNRKENENEVAYVFLYSHCGRAYASTSPPYSAL